MPLMLTSYLYVAVLLRWHPGCVFMINSYHWSNMAGDPLSFSCERAVGHAFT